MSPLKIITALLLIFVAVSVGYLVGHQEPAAETTETSTAATAETDTPTSAGDYSIYYFHGNNRCNTCLKLEALSHEAVTGGFADQLADHQLTWGVVNFEAPPNEHFAREFDLYSPALIIMENGPAEQRRWHNLTDIWDYVGDKDAYLKYVRSEVAGFINGG